MVINKCNFLLVSSWCFLVNIYILSPLQCFCSSTPNWTTALPAAMLCHQTILSNISHFDPLKSPFPPTYQHQPTPSTNPPIHSLHLMAFSFLSWSIGVFVCLFFQNGFPTVALLHLPTLIKFSDDTNVFFSAFPDH